MIYLWSESFLNLNHKVSYMRQGYLDKTDQDQEVNVILYSKLSKLSKKRFPIKSNRSL